MFLIITFVLLIRAAILNIHLQFLRTFGLAPLNLRALTMDGKQFSKEPNKLLNKDPFSNEDTRRLFEAIDQLRSCGANHEIELPEVRMA